MLISSPSFLVSSLVVGVLAYALAIIGLTLPLVQRNTFYANKVNPALYFQNLSDVEQFGFLHHQVQPFTVVTTDNETIHAWHILPVHLYHKHEEALKAQEDFGLKSSVEAYKTIGIRLLHDPNVHVVVSFHGNAAHIGSSYRPTTYQQMLGLSTPQRPVHVVAFDYRGFGLSTGQPTEEGIIQDGMAVMSFLTNLGSSKPGIQQGLSIQPSQIVLFGQSLGTAIATAVCHHWTIERLLPPFRGTVLIASFSSVPSLLLSYSIKGIFPPLLSPLNKFTRLQKWILSTIVDTWETDRRIGELVSAPNVPLNITIMHARNDGDIPWRNGWRNWEAAMAATMGMGEMPQGPGHEGDYDLEVLEWQSYDNSKRLRWERVIHGGHNRVAVSEQAKLAVLEILNGT